MFFCTQKKTCQESRVMNEVGSLFHSKSHEKLMQYLEDGGEKLLQKMLNFIEYGLGEASDEADVRKPFHRNTRTFAQLSLEQLRGLMQACHGPLWAEQLARRTRLQQMRQLLYFALKVDPGDFLPENNLYDLARVCQPRYRESQPSRDSINKHLFFHFDHTLICLSIK